PPSPTLFPYTTLFRSIRAAFGMPGRKRSWTRIAFAGTWGASWRRTAKFGDGWEEKSVIKATITVKLKPGVLDPQGEAVKKALHTDRKSTRLNSSHVKT